MTTCLSRSQVASILPLLAVYLPALVLCSTGIAQMCYVQSYATPDFVGCELRQFIIPTGMDCPGGPWEGWEVGSTQCTDFFTSNIVRNGTSLLDEPGLAEMEVGEDYCYTYNACEMGWYLGPPVLYYCAVARQFPQLNKHRSQHAVGAACPSTGN